MRSNYMKAIFLVVFFSIFFAVGYYIGKEKKPEIIKKNKPFIPHMHFHYNGCEKEPEMKSKIPIHYLRQQQRRITN